MKRNWPGGKRPTTAQRHGRERGQRPAARGGAANRLPMARARRGARVASAAKARTAVSREGPATADGEALSPTAVCRRRARPALRTRRWDDSASTVRPDSAAARPGEGAPGHARAALWPPPGRHQSEDGGAHAPQRAGRTSSPIRKQQDDHAELGVCIANLPVADEAQHVGPMTTPAARAHTDRASPVDTGTAIPRGQVDQRVAEEAGIPCQAAAPAEPGSARACSHSW